MKQTAYSYNTVDKKASANEKALFNEYKKSVSKDVGTSGYVVFTYDDAGNLVTVNLSNGVLKNITNLLLPDTKVL